MSPNVSASKRTPNRRAPGWMAVSRGAALGLSCLLTLNLLEVFAFSTSAVGNWFTDLTPLTHPFGVTLLAMAATSFLTFSMRPALPGPVLFASLSLSVIFAGFCGRELWQISRVAEQSVQATAMARPLGITMLFSVAAIGILSGNSPGVRGRSSVIAIFVSAILTLTGFVVVTIQSGGLSDPVPETSVPVIVVLGCGTDDENHAEALADRVNTASRMLLDEDGQLLVISCSPGSENENGDGDGNTAESDTMQRLAIAAGVDQAQLLIDDQAADPAASVKSAAMMPQLETDRRVIVVSHWYQLARLRLLAKRSGLEITAVAARQEHALFSQNLLVAGEAFSFLKCLLQSASQFFSAPAPG